MASDDSCSQGWHSWHRKQCLALLGEWRPPSQVQDSYWACQGLTSVPGAPPAPSLLWGSLFTASYPRRLGTDGRQESWVGSIGLSPSARPSLKSHGNSSGVHMTMRWVLWSHSVSLLISKDLWVSTSHFTDFKVERGRKIINLSLHKSMAWPFYALQHLIGFSFEEKNFPVGQK